MRRPGHPRPTSTTVRTGPRRPLLRIGTATVPLVAGLSLAAGMLGSAGLDRSAPAAPVAPALRTLSGSDNPLAGRPWGVYLGKGDQTYTPWVNATGTNKTLIGKIALAPKAKWFGGWVPDAEIAGKVRTYVANAQAGNPEALVQMAIFRMRPWEHDACKRLPTTAEQASYKRWVRGFAAGVGSAHAAIILQPDGPFALCAPGGSTLPSRLIAYSAKVLGALPNSSVYIDAGAADWPAEGRQGGVAAATRILTRAGVQYVRGFALNSTHYSSTPNEVARGAAIARTLASQGIPGKHFVVNTSSNGHPFTFGSYTGTDPDNAFVCKTRTEPVTRTCVTLGIPPTADVDNARWGLSATTDALARQYVDGYLWFGRPWLYRQNNPFVTSRALALVKSWPYGG